MMPTLSSMVAPQLVVSDVKVGVTTNIFFKDINHNMHSHLLRYFLVMISSIRRDPYGWSVHTRQNWFTDTRQSYDYLNASKRILQNTGKTS